MPRACRSAVGPREDTDGNEATHKRQIQHHPQPAEPFAPRARALLDAAQQRGDQRVQHGGSEDALDGAIGAVDTTPGFDAVDETVDFVQAGGEDAEGDDGGDELEDAREAEEPLVERAVLESLGDKAREETSLLGFVGAGVHGAIVRLATGVV